MKILIIGGVPKSLLNFRGPFIRMLVERGHTVAAAANGNDIDVSNGLKKIGIEYFPVCLERTTTNPHTDIKTFIQILQLVKRCKPDILFSYSIKPVIYSSLCGYFNRKIKIYALITGIGHVFLSENGIKNRIVCSIAKLLYRISLSKCRRVIFQNSDDEKYFRQKKMLHNTKSEVVSGSGVDVGYYARTPMSEEKIFLLIGRLLREKGIMEYYEAARIVKKKNKDVSFKLLGRFDTNPSSIKREELDEIVKDGVIEYCGQLDDVRPSLMVCRYYVLPSYREGTPRTVLEAMSVGRPIITTDVPGCRETIMLDGCRTFGTLKIGKNGILVPEKDPESLAMAMQYMLDKKEETENMAEESRRYVEKRYDVSIVNNDLARIMELNF